MAIHDSAQRAAAATAAPSGPPFDPMALNRPAIAARSALKIAVLNVAGGANLDAIAACLMRPPLADVGALMVCEASWRMPRHKSVEFAPALAAALKMSFVFLPSFGRIDSRNGMRALGNAILSARPLDDFQAIELPKPPNISKQLYLAGIHQGLLASINVDGRQVTLGVVHLERVWDPAGTQSADGKLPERHRRQTADHYRRRFQYDHPGHGSALGSVARGRGAGVASEALSRAAGARATLRSDKGARIFSGGSEPSGRADVYARPMGAADMAPEAGLDSGAWNPAGEGVGCGRTRAHVAHGPPSLRS